MLIKVHYSAVDGFHDYRTFKTLKGAQKYAQGRLGKHPECAWANLYAVSDDGIGKVSVTGDAKLKDLFPDEPVESTQSGFRAAQEAKGLVWIGDDHSEEYGVWLPKRLAQWDEYEACWGFNPRLAMMERDQYGMPVGWFDFAEDAQREAAHRQMDADRKTHWVALALGDDQWPF